MKFLIFASVLLYLFLSTHFSLGQCVVPNFSIPAEVCRGESLPVSNSTISEGTFEWDFCSGDLKTIEGGEIVVNHNIFLRSRSLKIVQDNEGLWFGFVISVTDNKMARLEFGNSLSNVPTVVDLGNLDGLLKGAYDFEIISEDDKWFGLVSNTTANNILLLDFGSSLTSVPLARSLGNFTQLKTPNAISIVQDMGSIHAFVSNGAVSNIIVFDFGSSISNIPTLSSINISGGSGLRGSSFIKECGNWYALVLSYGNSRVFQLSFNSGISNLPEVEQLNIPDLNFNYPANVELEYEGGTFHAFIQSALGDTYYVSFGSTISTSTGVGSNLGNFGLSTSNFPLQVIHDSSEWHLFNINQNDKNLNRFDFANNCSANTPVSNEKEPNSIAYSLPGTYNITLTGTDENGNVSSKTNSIVVNSSDAPEIDFGFNTEECISIAKGFSITSTPDQTITSHSWDFGDGTTSTGAEATHQYTTPGTYQVRLSVESENGCGNFIEKEVNIYAAPVPDFTFPTASICTNGEISFENTTPGEYKEEDITWSWDFGDDETSSEKSPNHTYTTGGTKTVTMTASIPGCSESKSYELIVIEGPSVNFVADRLCFGQTVQFTNLSEGADITEYAWNFGNGESSMEANPTVSFDEAGNYEVSLTVKNAVGCSNTLSKSIKVNALPVVSFDVASACSGAPVQFQDKSTIANGSVGSWLWKFGDGAEATVKNPSHTFETAGIYDVKLIVTTVAGCTDSVTQTVNVNISPIADFEVQLGCPGTLTRFIDTSQDPGNAGVEVNYWIINGIYHYTQNPAVLFTKAGTYSATLDITSGTSCRSTITKSIVIDPLPAANFSFENTCIGSPTAFSDQSMIVGEDIIESWSWRFGEFGTSFEQNPIFEFPETGSFPVTLTLTTQRGCTTIVNKTVTINQLPQANFSPQNNFGAPPLSVGFSNTSTGASNYQWWFGDAENSTSEEAAPVFVYNEVGDYEVKMVATSAGGCSDTAYATISVLISELDIALNNIGVFTNTGDMQIVLTLQNNGTVPISNMDITLDLGGVLSLNERFSETIGPGETLNYPVGFDILEKDLSGIAYICSNISVINVNIGEENLADNNRCVDIQGLFLLTDPYPNPINQTFNVEFFMPEKVAVGMVLTDMRGKIVMDIDLPDAKAGHNKYTYDFAHLAAGMYVVKISHKNESFVRKIMVQ